MTNINIKRKNNQIYKIVIKGHAGYDEIGHDIVCSSLSSIVTTTVNAIVRLDDKSLTHEEKSGDMQINILKHEKVIDVLIYNMIDLLKTLEKQYPKNIKINEEV